MLKRTTVYLNERIHRALKMKAIQRSLTLSDLINQAVQDSLKEDAIDLDAIQTRAAEPEASYEAVLKELKKDGLL